ncbi:hypothetical protein QBC42DRAFT_300553 [Cladorrhinum samala]|uniref:Uncharacterized protein n=1 Tax=Cladorrhinum samala TaxID=585594 RepID=A0AAV9HD42_9PEZI|nr:hypothetical protein QBC42DRAFT_300553 [Cladorrhinum samala]
MKLFQALIGSLLVALTAGQVTCTNDNCINRIINLGTQLGRAYCFTYLAPAVSGAVETVTSRQTVTALTTRTTTATPAVTSTIRTSVTTTEVVLGPRQIIATGISNSVLAACTQNAVRVTSACICYLDRPRVALPGV